MIEMPSDTDVQVIVKCMNIVLDSGEYCSGEIGARIGVSEEALRAVRDALSHMVGAEDEAAIAQRYGIAMDDLVLAIHNCLGDIGYALDIDSAGLSMRYGLSGDDVRAVYRKWAKVESEDTK